ncbi:MAG TPA: hypothetical protein VH084_16270, partial [Mycobacterium sp.]|nr:hypothetical protein [Mycobacterium sp.]
GRCPQRPVLMSVSPLHGSNDLSKEMVLVGLPPGSDVLARVGDRGSRLFPEGNPLGVSRNSRRDWVRTLSLWGIRIG